MMFSVVLLLLSSPLFAQTDAQQERITLSQQQAEAIFLDKNLTIIAQKLDISIADAVVIQAKLWPNPNVSIGEINLWSNKMGDRMSPVINNWGTTSQIAIDVEQLIQTAGKRGKLVALQQLNVKDKTLYLASLLRNLKYELQTQLIELTYLQAKEVSYLQQLNTFNALTAGYLKQKEEGNVSAAAYIRLSASALQIQKELSEIKEQKLQLTTSLKQLLVLDPHTELVISADTTSLPISQLQHLNVNTLTEEAISNRAEILLANNQKDLAIADLRLQKSLRIPNITVKANYDRGGSVMKDFVGFGAAMDLPFFNKNQGNIKAASFAIDKADVLQKNQTNNIQLEVASHLMNCKNKLEFYQSLPDHYEQDLEVMLDNYLRNFKSKNINMIEYLDFVKAYLDNKDILLNAKKELCLSAVALTFTIGKPLN